MPHRLNVSERITKEMSELNIKCIISGSETSGSVSVFKEIVDPGIGPPRHTHREQNEIFHVINGTIRFEIDGVMSELEAGGSALVQAGTVHAFRNIGDQPAVIHFEMLPSGNSEEAFDLLVNGEIEDAPAFFDKYGMDLVGPPLE